MVYILRTFPIGQAGEVDESTPGRVEVVVVLNRSTATEVNNIPHLTHYVALLERVEAGQRRLKSY